MSILQLPHARPAAILLDWHATLVDTHDAMYHAVDDVLPHLEELDLWDRLLDPDDSKTIEDAKLLIYVKDHRRLHPKIVAQRKISRTDIFEVLFGSDQDAKGRAHQAFDNAYKKYVEDVHPLEADIRQQLERIRAIDIPTGLISNRKRDFLEHELALVDGTGWEDLFDVVVCGSDVERRKPAPDMLLEALNRLHLPADERCWYIGDSTTDVIAAKEAGITSIFYNGAGWPQSWLDKIFPDTIKHPHRPDAVVGSIAELADLARHLLAQHKRVVRAQS
ncbi:haloacid dehalogenase [Alcanivorax sp. MD8A]|uniref:HAD family hydrolase n=1 Tax=Alcanivorax sp. MD8A TaxID=1177157 RepID=UPI000C9C65C1|nr:HAD-IA family hydrolase [Alcanivorax sp. MD8A]PNE01835.1 haloacid dehalogenase [Alcanivorax sp. MD8A]